MARMETGPVRFGDDWTGVFIRGDEAFGTALMLESGAPGAVARAVSILSSCHEGRNPDVRRLAPNLLTPAELDAERARAAELQQRLDAQPYESEGELVRLLAAREAEVVELREALEVAWGIIANAHGGDWSLASEQWQWAAARWRDDSWHAILSRAPGGNEALRTLLERAWMAGAGTKASDFEDERPDQVCARDLARLLGPTGDGEPLTKG